MMYIKAERRAKSIGGFIRDEMMIAMGDTVSAWVPSFFHHDDGAPQWRAWGPPTGSLPVRGRPNSGMRYFFMYINVVQRAESIGGFVGDEIVIAMGDMAQKHQKTALPGWNQS